MHSGTALEVIFTYEKVIKSNVYSDIEVFYYGVHGEKYYIPFERKRNSIEVTAFANAQFCITYTSRVSWSQENSSLFKQNLKPYEQLQLIPKAVNLKRCYPR